MNKDQDNLFEDPVLRKGAVAAWTGDRAPTSLTDRIRLAMSQVQTDGTDPLPGEQASDGQASAGAAMRLADEAMDDQEQAGRLGGDSSDWPRESRGADRPNPLADNRPTFPRFFQLFASLAAAAAVVALGVMLINPLLTREGKGGRPIAAVPGNSGTGEGLGDGPVVLALAKLPSGLGKQILQLHDYCSSVSDHHGLASSRTDFDAIHQELATAAKGPAWVFDLTKEGWRFHGAERCPLGDQRISHLVFDRKDNDVELSIMTIPLKPEWNMAEGMQVSEQVDASHWVVAFVTGGQMFTLVESGPASDVSLASLEQMRDQYRSVAMAPAQQAGNSSHARIGLKSPADPFVIRSQPNYTQRPNEYVDANVVGGPGRILWGAGPVWRG